MRKHCVPAKLDCVMRKGVYMKHMMGVLILLTACMGFSVGDDTVAATHADKPVVIVARDYGFTGPDRIPAGMTTVQVVNQGKDLHHVQIMQLTEGKTAADFQAAMKADSSHPPAWAKLVGGPNAVMPGGEATATMVLSAGNYLLLCLIPDSKGVPHVALGMVKPLTIETTKRPVAAPPDTDLTITMTDFVFALSQPITAGMHTLHVKNAGNQPHEVVVVKLDDGKTVKDFGAAFAPGASGPPPGQAMGGLVGIEEGATGYFTGQFDPGRYGLICFFPDSTTGAPHFTKGMVLDFTVR